MSLIFHERVGLDGRRVSPFSWRIRYALAHKGIEPVVVETRFADVERIRKLSGQHFVPIIEDEGQVIYDTWNIACHLEDHYPDAPSLFDGPIGRGTTRLLNIWSDTILASAMRPQIYGDFIWCLDPKDRAYFRQSREAQLGMTLEDYSYTRETALPKVADATEPLERTLAEQPFLAGQAPAYADYIVFSVFQWARVGSDRDALFLIPNRNGTRAWRDRMVALYGGLGNRFPLFPKTKTGPDGR